MGVATMISPLNPAPKQSSAQLSVAAQTSVMVLPQTYSPNHWYARFAAPFAGRKSGYFGAFS
jgi:hypothetical protein